MKLKRLDHYLLSEFAAPLLLVVLGLATLVTLVQVVDTLPRLREWGAPAHLIVLFHLFQFPYLVTQVIPVGVMLATLLSLGALARHSELADMGAGGVSRARIGLPLLAAALGLSLALLFLSETLVPAASLASRTIQKVRIEKRDLDYDVPWRNHMAKNLSGGRQLYCEGFDARAGIMQGVTLLRMDKGIPRWRLDARSARHQEGGVWLMQEGVERSFEGPEGEVEKARRFKAWPLDLGAAPRDFMVDSDRKEQDLLQLPIRDLDRIIAVLKATGADYRKELVCLHLRLSYPFSCLILALLGVSLPYLFPSGRRAMTGAALGLLASLACGMVYLVFIQVGISLGKSGKLPIVLSAWLGNIVFAGLGGWTLWKVNR